MLLMYCQSGEEVLSLVAVHYIWVFSATIEIRPCFDNMHNMDKWMSLSVLVGYNFLRRNTECHILSEVSPLCRGLADTKQTGKLTREQFSLAMYLIQQKVTKGMDPPSTLTSDMIPPSERTATSVAAPVSPDFIPKQSPLSIAAFIKMLPIFHYCACDKVQTRADICSCCLSVIN